MTGPRLAGKSAIVTGAAGGMGEAITRTLVAAGARVVACDRAAEPLRALCLQAVAAAARDEIRPIDDVRASAWYRRELVHNMTLRMLQDESQT